MKKFNRYRSSFTFTNENDTTHITKTLFVYCCVLSQEDLEEKRRPKVVFFVLFCLLWLKEIKQWRWEKKSDEYKVEE
jgi:hypothetical protein